MFVSTLESVSWVPQVLQEMHLSCMLLIAAKCLLQPTGCLQLALLSCCKGLLQTLMNNIRMLAR